MDDANQAVGKLQNLRLPSQVTVQPLKDKQSQPKSQQQPITSRGVMKNKKEVILSRPPSVQEKTEQKKVVPSIRPMELKVPSSQQKSNPPAVPKPIFVIKKKPILFPPKYSPPHPVQKNEKDKTPLSKERDVELVRQLPSNLVPNKKSPREASISHLKLLPLPPSILELPTNSQQEIESSFQRGDPNNPISTTSDDSPTPIDIQVKLEEHVSQPDDEIIVAQEDIVNWKIHNMSSDQSDEEQEMQPVNVGSQNTEQGKSKLGIIDQLLKQVESLKSRKQELLYPISKKIGKEKTEQLVQFFHNLSNEQQQSEEDDSAINDKIHKFVFGKIAFEDAHYVQDIYLALHLDERIAECEEEVKQLLS